MKYITNQSNTRWQMEYARFKKTKKKQNGEPTLERIKSMQKLFEILQYNAEIMKFNHENK